MSAPFLNVKSMPELAVTSLNHAGPVGALALSADGNVVLTGGADKVVRLSQLGGKELRVVTGAEAPITSVSQNNFVAAGSATVRAATDEGIALEDGRMVRLAGIEVGATPKLSAGAAVTSPRERHHRMAR